MAKAKLTDPKIRGLQQGPNGRAEFADHLLEGLRIRVSKSAKVWIMRFRIGGKVRTITLGEFGDEPGQLGLADARIKGEEMRKQAKRGEVPSLASQRRDTRVLHKLRDQVDAFMIQYPAESKREIKRPEMMRWMFNKYIVPHLGDRPLGQVDRDELEAFVKVIEDGHGTTTARRVMALVKRLFKHAQKKRVIKDDPAVAVDLPGRENARRRKLSEAEIRAFWSATDPATKPDERNRAGRIKPHPSDWPWGPYFRLLLILGQRRGEVARMRWSAIDLKAKTWFLEASETKAGRDHIVPLPPMAVEILESLPRFTTLDADGKERPCTWVLTTNGRTPIADFSKPKTWLDAAMVKELKTAGIDNLPHWQVHDLRRTFYSGLGSLRVKPHIRSRCVNHALEALDRHYDCHDYLDEKEEALALWAAELERIISGRERQSKVVPIRASRKKVRQHSG